MDRRKFMNLAAAFIIAQGTSTYLCKASEHNSIESVLTQEVMNPIDAAELANKYPYDIPSHPNITWNKHQPGFYQALVDVNFHGKLVDRIQMIRVYPEIYRFEVHTDRSLYTIEQWRKSLDALCVINGSYFAAEPYGAPVTPILSNGKGKGPKKYTSHHGGFFAEPKDNMYPLATFSDFRNLKAPIEIDNFPYNQGVVSYPTLLDIMKNVNVKQSGWKATRTFMARDRYGYIILAKTESGFFSLWRLGHFLKNSNQLNLSYALNMDGGLPSSMAVKVGDFEYASYGNFEQKMKKGKLQTEYNSDKSKKWYIPNVISVHKR